MVVASKMFELINGLKTSLEEAGFKVHVTTKYPGKKEDYDVVIDLGGFRTNFRTMQGAYAVEYEITVFYQSWQRDIPDLDVLEYVKDDVDKLFEALRSFSIPGMQYCEVVGMDWMPVQGYENIVFGFRLRCGFLV